MKKVFLISLIIFSISSPILAKPVSLKNEINFTANVNFQDGYWRPELNLTFIDTQKFMLDARITPNLRFMSYPGRDMELDLDLYRLWGRVSTENWFVRIGRQKLNFGSAKYLRPLQWFDSINPLDPLKQSVGIDAVLARYYLGTANFWLWAVDEEEFNSTTSLSKDSKPNFGARIENSLTYCDAAITTNFKQTEHTGLESKLGIDIRWDTFIGYWLESSITNYSEADEVKWDRYLSLGVDYTINSGKGIYTMLEFMNRAKSETSLWGSDQDFCYTALSTSYPISIISNLNFSCISNWKYDYSLLNLTMDMSTDYLRFMPYLNWSSQHEDLIDSLNIDEIGIKIYLNF